MISPAVLEQPGRWRSIGTALLLLLVVSPLLPSLVQVFEQPGTGLELGADFVSAVGRSIGVAACAAGAAFVLGFPCGLLAGLYRFPGRQPLLAALAVPLLMPSFLWAIGLSMLRIDLGLPQTSFLSGGSGTVWSFAALGTPLVVFAVLVAVRLLPGSAIDAARLAGGERAVLRYAGYAALPAGAAGALLTGIVSLTDPGPGQILGFAGIATQILISFAALYDFELAVRQGLVTAAIVIVAASPLIWIVARYLTMALLAREANLMKPRRWKTANRLGPTVLGLTLLVTLFAPVTGLLTPVLTQLWVGTVVDTVARTAANTFFYSAVAGLVATAVAVPLAICANRFTLLRVVVFSSLMLIFVLPPSIGALGTVLLASSAPDWLDPILRSRFTVAAVLGLRLTAVAAFILVRAIGTTPPSWAAAAAVHGVPLLMYLRKVLAPFLLGPTMISIGLVALVATADITTVLLLQPPGEDSLPVALFTVMANAPESMVATLCLAYVLLGCLVIGAMTLFGGIQTRRASLFAARTTRGRQ